MWGRREYSEVYRVRTAVRRLWQKLGDRAVEPAYRVAGPDDVYGDGRFSTAGKAADCQISGDGDKRNDLRSLLKSPIHIP